MVHRDRELALHYSGKVGDRRRDRWQQAYGPALFEAGLIASPDQAAQVEIDALAALRPNELRRIAEAAIAPYLDAGLAMRFETARAAWQAEADAMIAREVDEATVADLELRGEDAVEEYNQVLEQLRAAKEELDALESEADELANGLELPGPPEPPEPEIDEAAHDPLIDLEWDFVTGTQALRARKAYDENGAVNGAEDDDEEP